MPLSSEEKKLLIGAGVVLVVLVIVNYIFVTSEAKGKGKIVKRKLTNCPPPVSTTNSSSKIKSSSVVILNTPDKTGSLPSLVTNTVPSGSTKTLTTLSLPKSTTFGKTTSNVGQNTVVVNTGTVSNVSEPTKIQQRGVANINSPVANQKYYIQYMNNNRFLNSDGDLVLNESDASIFSFDPSTLVISPPLGPSSAPNFAQVHSGPQGSVLNVLNENNQFYTGDTEGTGINVSTVAGGYQTALLQASLLFNFIPLSS